MLTLLRASTANNALRSISTPAALLASRVSTRASFIHQSARRNISYTSAALAKPLRKQDVIDKFIDDLGTVLPARTRNRILEASSALKDAKKPKPKAKAASSKRKKTKASAKSKPRKTMSKKKAAAPKKRVAKKKPKEAKFKITAEMKKPRTPSNGFFIFRSKFSQATDMPKTKVSDLAAISKECGELWRGLSEVEKQPFNDEAAIRRKEHDAKMGEWTRMMLDNPGTLRKMNEIRAQKGKSKLHAKQASIGRAPKPLTGYLRFYRAIKDEMDGSPRENASEAGKRWRALPQSEKDIYKAAYREEAAEWKTSRANV